MIELLSVYSNCKNIHGSVTCTLYSFFFRIDPNRYNASGGTSIRYKTMTGKTT